MINLDTVLGAGANARADTMFAERGGALGWPRLSAVASATGLGSELVVNPTFDVNIAGWTTFGGAEYWTTSPHSGAGCARLTEYGSNFGGVGQVFAVAAGATYRLSVWTRQTVPAVQAFFRAEWSALAGASLGYLTGKLVNFVPFTTTWALYEFEGVAPAGAVRLTFFIQGTPEVGPGPVFVDDIGFRQVMDTDFADGVESVVVTRELSGDLPEEATLLGGAVSADVQIVADLRDGIGPHPASAADRAAWLGKPVRVSAGFNGYFNDPPTNAVPLLAPVFDGILRSIGFDDAASQRTSKIMEKSDRMRAAVTVAPYGSTAGRMLPAEPRRYPTNLTALLVAALHASGIRVTPPPSAEVIWSAPLVAGCLADVGCTVPEGGGIPDGATWLVDAPFGKHPKSPTGVGFNLIGHPADRVMSQPYCLQFEAWFNRTSTPATVIATIPVSGDRNFVLEYDGSGTLTASVKNSVTNAFIAGKNATVGTGWHHVAARFMYGATSYVDIRVDGANSTPVSTTGITWTSAVVNFLQCRLSPDYVQQASLHAKMTESSWLAPEVIAAALTAYPQADLDLASLEVDWLPGLDARVAWELCKEIAQAELGMVGFSEYQGRFYFKNRAALNGSTTPVATLGTDLVDNVRGEANIDSVRDLVTTTVTRRWFLESGYGGETLASTAAPIYMHGAVLEIPTGEGEFLLSIPKPMLPDSVSVVRPNVPGLALESTTMALCDDAEGTVRYTGALVYSSLHFVSPTVWKLRTMNVSAAVRYAVWPADWDEMVLGLRGGQGSLIIMGRGTDDELALLESPVKVGTGTRVLALAPSLWRDNVAKVAALAAQLLASLSTPRLQVDDITIPADLRLQVGDPVQLNDWAGRVPTILARITRLKTTVGVDVPDGIAQTVSLRTLS